MRVRDSYCCLDGATNSGAFIKDDMKGKAEMWKQWVFSGKGDPVSLEAKPEAEKPGWGTLGRVWGHPREPGRRSGLECTQRREAKVAPVLVVRAVRLSQAQEVCR